MADAPETVTAPATREHVRADHVEISQGGAGSIEATTVSLQQGGAGRVRAQEISVSQGGVAVARADELRLGDGASAFAVIADRASVGTGANIFMLLARSVDGNVRAVLDWRAAAAFGAALGAVIALLRRRR